MKMNYDNKVLNVNGEGDEGLLLALELAFLQHGKRTTCSGWSQSKEHGFILHWHRNGTGVIPFSHDLSLTETFAIVKGWLNGEFAKTLELDGWDRDNDHDGHNGTGWRVYSEDWGKVGGKPYSICAIKRIFVWVGK